MSAHTYRRLPFALLLALTALSAPVAAQDPCRLDETVARCWDRLLADLQKTAVAPEKKSQEEAPKKTETGLADIAGLSSSVKDFLPLLQLTGVLGAVQKDDQTGAVAIALNTPFLGSTRSMDRTDNALQLKAVIETKAALYEPLKKKIPEKDRAAVEKQLLGSKDDAQHVTLQGSYNFSSRKLGRNFALHSDTLDTLFEEATKGEVQRRDANFLATAAAFFLKLTPGTNISTTLIKAMTPADQQAVQTLVMGVVKAEAAANQAFVERLREVGLDVYGQLVLNQPQLQISGSRSFRDDLFGPDLKSARISYERGIGNSLNAALGSYNGTCATAATACLAQYAKFLKDPQTRAAIKAGTRLAIWFEIINNDAYHFITTDPAIDVALTEGSSKSLGVDFGRLIGVDDAGTASGRVDLSVRGEWPHDKSSGAEDRFVASLTITKKVGDISIPFGIVYANKEKFLAQNGANKGLSANVGLKFNLFPALN